MKGTSREEQNAGFSALRAIRVPCNPSLLVPTQTMPQEAAVLLLRRSYTAILRGIKEAKSSASLLANFELKLPRNNTSSTMKDGLELSGKIVMACN